ncbi:MAG: class I mannose-6-phosphate isomerase [Candidatus Symbiothrix sp.]|jgi:mannose-6-phosphate isomerase|nr:class I mannose-6-phosphate isomerase [Candidatus Symbiothrix sp.]
MYPLKFEPILKPIIWGGNQIAAFKNLPATDGIGESWEISGVPGDVSVVSNGPLKGQSLTGLLEKNGEKLLGKAVYERFGTTFPLLIKFIDARTPLSIQVHPNDELAEKRHHSFGKTEMWYVVKADDGASLYSGFRKPVDVEKYVRSLADDTFTDYLQQHEVEAGDVFFLPAGRVHAIGAGCFMAEIQQTSNITYRIYDYNRTDANGNPRELHTDLAKDAIDYRLTSPKKDVLPITCPYFTTDIIEICHCGLDPQTPHTTLTRSHNDTFVIYIGIKGKLTLTDASGISVTLQQGETVLVPAENSSKIELKFEKESKLLEVHC